jgi:hypothetical protein
MPSTRKTFVISLGEQDGSATVRRSLIGFAIAIGAFLLAFGVTPARAAPTVVADCPPPPDTESSIAIDFRVAQVFTSSLTGALVRGEIEVQKSSSGGDWTMEIYATDGAGNPTNVLLASTTIADASVPTGVQTRLVGVFAAPAQVQAGQQYAISLRRSGPTWDIKLHTDDPCSGRVYLSLGPDDEAWAPTDPGHDLVFTAFVEPEPEPPPPPQPAPKADGTLTIDANKGKVEKGRKVTLTGQLDVPSNESCEPGRAIQIQRRLKSEDDSKFQTFETVQTDATGNYSHRVKVKKTYFYRAVVAETEACDDETSNSVKVRVQKKEAAQEA